MGVTKQIALFEADVNVGEIDVNKNGEYNAVIVGDNKAVANIANKYATTNLDVRLTGKTADELKAMAAGKVGELIAGADELQNIMSRIEDLASAEDSEWHLNDEGDNMSVPSLNYNLFIEDEKYILSMPNERKEFETESDFLRYVVENKLPKLPEDEFRMLHEPVPTGSEEENEREDKRADRQAMDVRGATKESVIDYDDIALKLKQHIEQNGKLKSNGSGRRWISDNAAMQFIKKITNTRGTDADRIFAQVIVRLPYGMLFNSPVSEDAAAGVTAGLSIAPGVFRATAGKLTKYNKKTRMREAIEKLLK